MINQKSYLTLASAAALFAFTNGAMMASAYAADQGTQAAAPCYGVNSCKGQSDCKSGSQSTAITRTHCITGGLAQRVEFPPSLQQVDGVDRTQTVGKAPASLRRVRRNV